MRTTATRFVAQQGSFVICLGQRLEFGLLAKRKRLGFCMPSPLDASVDLRKPFPGSNLRNPGEINRLFVDMHRELRGLAQVVFEGQASEHTLQPTALVNEAWLKLAGHPSIVNDRHHFLALAAKAMRQILIDHARGKGRSKRGGDRSKLTLIHEPAEQSAAVIDCVAFTDALEKLERLHARHAQVAEMRLLGALTISEIAQLLDIGEATVRRDWQAAQAWLARELGP